MFILASPTYILSLCSSPSFPFSFGLFFFSFEKSNSLEKQKSRETDRNGGPTLAAPLALAAPRRRHPHSAHHVLAVPRAPRVAHLPCRIRPRRPGGRAARRHGRRRANRRRVPASVSRRRRRCAVVFASARGCWRRRRRGRVRGGAGAKAGGRGCGKESAGREGGQEGGGEAGEGREGAAEPVEWHEQFLNDFLVCIYGVDIA
ncbi:hypothetical protein BB8028_0004g04200 [Beauveria bassiana]|uniref:Uncharacterized protein n=1 Tax=Beauveria bassiana TaxID=176275 RepID=A0A2S7YBV5_BEABA|nr:hypothetical protein BB8028_0004g04200 [Beauveria bassiana]